MAYISQDDKAALTPAINAVLNKYNVKGTIGTRNHSELVVSIQSGAIDFGRGHIQVNHYCIDRDYSGTAREFLNELLVATKGDKWYDQSDRMVDYFDVAYYISINIGRWNKLYVCTAAAVAA